MTTTGHRGTVFSRAKRAAADIRTAPTERESDLTPYTVRMDSGGHFSAYRGRELAPICAFCDGVLAMAGSHTLKVEPCPHCNGEES